MVVHFENAAFAGRAVMRTVGLARLTFLTEPSPAGRFDGERRQVLLRSRFVGR